MNKDEILEEETDSFKIMTRLKSDTLEAMDIYAKQECISFLEYVVSYKYRELEEGATYIELYNLYFEQSKQKQKC